MQHREAQAQPHPGGRDPVILFRTTETDFGRQCESAQAACDSNRETPVNPVILRVPFSIAEKCAGEAQLGHGRGNLPHPAPAQGDIGSGNRRPEFVASPDEEPEGTGPPEREG